MGSIQDFKNIYIWETSDVMAMSSPYVTQNNFHEYEERQYTSNGIK